MARPSPSGSPVRRRGGGAAPSAPAAVGGGGAPRRPAGRRCLPCGISNNIMTEGWVDCPSLGPGWQRREVLRKNGTRPGQSDTYYTSPRGEKIRSRVELLRLLGGSRDLTDFDFKKGIFIEPGAEPQPPEPLPATEGGHQQVKKSSKRHLPPLAAATPPLKKPPDLQVFQEPADKEVLDQKPPKLEVELPVEAPAAILAEQQELLVAVDQAAMKPRKRRHRKHLPAFLPPGKMGNVTVEEAKPEEPVVCCASCQGQFPGVMLPPQRRCRWLCPDCRAQRRDFNREQRYYKQIGCGVCQACQMSQDCGICSVCVLRAKSPELRIGIKCLLRRCLKIVKKGLECGMCQACKITEDCGSCQICLRRQKPGMKRQWKCLKRRCLKRKKKHPPKKDGYSTKKLTVQTSGSRRNRKCGKCEACLLKMDCGRCDFCCDKPKFGGRNLKRQKCRWRQCLHFAMESPSGTEQGHLPRLQSPEEPEEQPAVKWKIEPEMSGSILAQDLAKDRPTLPHVQEESEVLRRPTPPSQVLVKQSDTRLPAVNLLIATSPVDKQEHAEPCGDRQPSNDSPRTGLTSSLNYPPGHQGPFPGQVMHVSAGLPQCKWERAVQGKEVVVLDDEDDEEVEQLQQLRPPVIMEIYSLGGRQPLAQLDSVLHEFLAELNEIPLPAHWEVLSPLCGPDLRLVQRSEHSTMSSAVIYIRPGLFFHVVVQNLPVPPEHELYASHPARLTTVDEVVELICDLEAYRLCSGWPAGWHAGERSEACDVLVYSGCCPQCRLNPWPSGRGTR